MRCTTADMSEKDSDYWYHGDHGAPPGGSGRSYLPGMLLTSNLVPGLEDLRRVAVHNHYLRNELALPHDPMTSGAPVSDLYPTSRGHVCDLYQTSRGPVCDLYLTSRSHDSDLCATSTTPVSDLYVTSKGHVSDLYPTSQGSASDIHCHIKSSAHPQRLYHPGYQDVRPLQHSRSDLDLAQNGGFDLEIDPADGGAPFSYISSVNSEGLSAYRESTSLNGLEYVFLEEEFDLVEGQPEELDIEDLLNEGLRLSRVPDYNDYHLQGDQHVYRPSTGYSYPEDRIG